MPKVVINTCFGGFSVSNAVMELLNLPTRDDTDKIFGDSNYPDLGRDNPELVAAVELLGSSKASGAFAELRVVDVKEKYWEIVEYDGSEHINASDSPIVSY